MTMPARIAVSTMDQLVAAVEDAMAAQGPRADLNHIDVAQMRVFDGLFSNTAFDGDVSQWDMANAISVEGMFRDCPFNGDISQWNMASVKRAKSMFYDSQFNGDISQWNVGRLEVTNHMFYHSAFNGDISKWDVGALTHATGMFAYSSFNGDVSAWRPLRLEHAKNMFHSESFQGDLSAWPLVPCGHYTGFVHRTFVGRLPETPCADPFALYTSMLGSPLALNEHASKVDFSLLHIDLLLASPNRCSWACMETLRWAWEHKKMGKALGLSNLELRGTMMQQYREMERGDSTLHQLNSENFLP